MKLKRLFREDKLFFAFSPILVIIVGLTTKEWVGATLSGVGLLGVYAALKSRMPDKEQERRRGKLAILEDINNWLVDVSEYAAMLQGTGTNDNQEKIRRANTYPRLRSVGSSLVIKVQDDRVYESLEKSMSNILKSYLGDSNWGPLVSDAGRQRRLSNDCLTSMGELRKINNIIINT